MGTEVKDDRDSVVRDVSKLLFDLSQESSGFERVVTYEVAEASRVAEALERDSPRAHDAPEIVPTDAIYALLGGDALLVDPVLTAQRVALCSYGGQADRQRVLQEVAERAGRELLNRAERLVAVKLFSLRIALLECSSKDANSSVVLDLLGQQIIDAAGITRESVDSIMRPLTVDTLSSIVELLDNRSPTATQRTGHFILHLEAGHANDAGTLTLVSVASPESEAPPLGASGSRIPQALHDAQHFGSLRQLQSVATAFTHCGERCEEAAGHVSSLLFLAPASFSQTSDFSRIAHESTRLRDERREESHALELPVTCCRGGFTAGLCMLPSPPMSEHASWDCSATPSAFSSPDLRGASMISPVASLSKAAVKEDSMSKAASRTLSTLALTLERAPLAASTDDALPPCLTPKSNFFDTPQQFLRRLNASELSFDANTWMQQAKEAGTSPEQQVQNLLRLVLDFQKANHDVVDSTRRFVTSYLGTNRASVVPSGSMVGAPVGSFARIPARSGSPPTGARTIGSPGMLGALSMPAPGSEPFRWSNGLPGVRVEGPSMASANAVPCPHYAASSPRWAAPIERSPVRQPSDMCLHDSIPAHDANASMDAIVVASPLARSHSANLPSGSMLNFMQQQQWSGAALTKHGDTAMSPKVPARDFSPARSRSVIQARPPIMAGAQSPQAAQHSSNMLLYPSGSSSMQPVGAIPSFPPPLQVSATPATGFGLSLETQMAQSSPRELQRTHLLDDGMRSPMPMPPGHGPPFTRAHDCTPHSARSGLVAPNANARWDQGSPRRIRYVGISGTGNLGGSSPTVGVSLGNSAPRSGVKGMNSSTPLRTVGQVPNRSILGPPPKTNPPGAKAGINCNGLPVGVGIAAGFNRQGDNLRAVGSSPQPHAGPMPSKSPCKSPIRM